VIPVQPAPEPDDFDRLVRQRGLSELAVMIGKRGWVTRTGPRRKQIIVAGKPVTRVKDIPPERLPPYWRAMIPQLCEAYNRICAYVCVYIERVTGAPSVDHWHAKASEPHQAYEWANLRLVCSIMNSQKGIKDALIDPFLVEDGWFALDFVDFSVVPGVGPEHPRFAAIDHTISSAGLDLNRYECRKLREVYVGEYLQGEVSWSYLERRAPFIARELRRQELSRER
jgi:hypothetical protein